MHAFTAEFNPIYGVDFSGGQNAHRYIWVAKCEPQRERLRVVSCRQAGELEGATGLEPALASLRRLIASEPGSLAGMDFPFSVPAGMMQGLAWEQFAKSLYEKFSGPLAFSETMHTLTGGSEPRRAGDVAARTPFSPINRRVVYQTFHGTGGVLWPLVRDGVACVLPAQVRVPGRATVIEVCPASTLISIGIKSKLYKGKMPAHRAKRQEILERLTSRHCVEVPDAPLRERVLSNTGGDALDAIIAATAAFAAARLGDLHEGPRNPIERLEGRIYFRLD